MKKRLNFSDKVKRAQKRVVDKYLLDILFYPLLHVLKIGLNLRLFFFYLNTGTKIDINKVFPQCCLNNKKFIVQRPHLLSYFLLCYLSLIHQRKIKLMTKPKINANTLTKRKINILISQQKRLYNHAVILIRQKPLDIIQSKSSNIYTESMGTWKST